MGCVAYRAADALVFVDPLVPRDDRGGFWRWADGLVEAHGGPVAALTTLGFHRRDRDLLVERYRATTSRARARLPEGVEPIRIAGAGETMLWLAEHRALVAGDRLVGDSDGGLHTCPPSWLRYLPSGMTIAGLRAALAPLRDLPVEMVLVAHGEPVLAGGRAAIGRALRADR